MKRFITLFIGLVILSFLYTSCDNDGILSGTTIIEGKVLEYGTNKPVENATVTLYERVSTGSFSGTDFAVETIITDASGSYSFESEGLGRVGVNATHDNYFEPNMITYDGIVYNDKNNIDIVIDPHAWLKLHIKNVNPVNQNDEISISQFCEGNYPQLFGENIDTTVLCRVRGDKEFDLTSWVYKGGQQEKFTTKILCQAHDTTLYELFY